MPTRPRSFRLVCTKAQINEVERLLAAEGFRFSPEPFSCWCRQLLFEPFPLGLSLAAFFGYIYIQDRASMLPPLALAPEQGSGVIDLAASPGSKSGFLAQLVGTSGFVLANEPNRTRLATLRANLQASNLLQTATCSYPGEKMPGSAGMWQYALLDPPCSGWGTVAKNPRAAKIWQGSKIGSLISLQRKLLIRAAALLGRGGMLLYSTCTTNPAENSEQTHFAIEELGLEPVPLEPFPGFTFDDVPDGALLINGQASESQGFYLSLLRKSAGVARRDYESASFECLIPRGMLASAVCDPRLLPAGEIGLFGGKARFLPLHALNNLGNGFRWQGFLLGRLNNAAFIPAPRLRALLPSLDAFPNATRIVLESIEETRKLLSGAGVVTDLKAHAVALWWHTLPLGICQIRNGRVISNFK